MRIAVIGAGAMGSIYGGHLSQHNEVILVDTNQQVVEQINKNGLLVDENGTSVSYQPKALCDTSEEKPVDLVILFVKALFSRAALENNSALIGPDTRLMTLQNGAGHEDLLKEFVSEDRVIIGTTEDNSAVLGLGHVRRGGTGVTNVSLSALTGVLQVDMGYIAADEFAWKLCCQLIHETILTAAAAGLEFDEEAVREKVRKTSLNNPQGCTSIRADLRDGRRTEVDTISGSVVRAAAKYGVDVPGHTFVVNLVHAMEGRK